jgi:hypothetical protein
MIMANWPCRRRRRVGLCVSVLGVVLQISGTRSAPIAWSKQGAFEACLEASLEKWLQAQAALVVNEDPAAGRLDDAVVAKWTVDILSLCRMQAGTGNPDSESRFTGHMVRWRHHIFDAASMVKKQGAAD